MNKRNQFYKRWLTMAPAGLTLVGLGLCLTIDAGFAKHDGAHWSVWVPYGTVALVVFNAGLSVFGDAIINRLRYLQSKSGG